MDLKGLMEKASQLQASMNDLKGKLSTIEVTGESGGGLVRVTLSCEGECRAVHLDESLLKTEEKDILEDLIIAAMNHARQKIEEESQKRMAEMTKDLPLPPGFKL